MKRRNAIFQSTQKLYSITENISGINIKLFSGDIVSVIDDTSNSFFWIIRKNDSIGYIHKKYLKPIDKTSIGVYYMNSKHQDHFSAQHQIESRLGPMPYFYEILGSKVIEHSGKNVVVFFILVKAYATSSNPLRKGEGLTEETWIVAKSQRCFMRLVESLERYLGQGGVPCVPDVKTRKPIGWTVERWLQYRCDALQSFFTELRHPRRGLITPTISTSYQDKSYLHSHVLDNPNVTLRSNFTPSGYRSDHNYDDFTYDGVYGNDERTIEFSTPQKHFTSPQIQQSSLLEALVPLNIFLRTDKVKLHIISSDPNSSDSKDEVISRQINFDPNSTTISNTDASITNWSITINNMLIEPFPPTPALVQDYIDFLGEPGAQRPKSFPPFPEYIIEDVKPYTDEELSQAVKSGNFEISMFTPISSLLRIWSAVSADHPKDHNNQNNLDTYGFESEKADESELGNNNNNDDDDDLDKSGDEEEKNSWMNSNFEHHRLRCLNYSSRAAKASVTALGADGKLNLALNKYLEKPRKRTTSRPSITGLLINEKQKSVTNSIEKYQHILSCMSDYLKDTKDSRSGLNAFAQFSLSSLVVSIKQNSIDQTTVNNMNGKSLHDINLLHAQSTHNMNKSMSNMKSSQKKLVNSFYDTGSDSILGLNEKINTLSLAWERRRMEALQREQDILEGLVSASSTQNPENNELKIKYCEYMSQLDQTTKPYPSQLNSFEPMTSSSLSKWLALRAKSRLSRKSDRVVKIERMQKLEQTFQKLRITIEQFVAIMDVIDQDDEKQHALYTLICKITDCIELDNYNIWSPLTLNAEDEKKANLIISAMRSEAKAEQFYKKIFYLYELIVKHRKTGKQILAKIPKGFNTPTWKDLSDPSSIPPKSKVSEFKQDIQTLRKLITECRNCIDEGASYVTDGAIEQTNAANFTLELKKLVSKSEAVSKMKGVLSAGKPEYLVHMKLKTSLMATERARTLSAQAVDEIASTYTLLKRVLSELEETLSLLTEYAQYIQRKHLNIPSNGSIGSADGDDVGIFDDDILDDNPQHENIGMSSAGGMASGWRREMHEIFVDNYYKFKKSCGIENDTDTAILLPPSINPLYQHSQSQSRNNNNSNNNSNYYLPNQQSDPNSTSNYLIDLTRMCILLSRIPLLRDTHTAIEEWNERENEMNNEDDDLNDITEDMVEDEDDEEGNEDGDEENDIEDEERHEMNKMKTVQRRGGVVKSREDIQDMY